MIRRALNENLTDVETDIYESGSYSDYINVYDIKDVYSKGIHVITLRGSEELKKGTYLEVEIVDDGGRPIPINTVNSSEEYEDRFLPLRRFSFEVTDETLNGVATITFVATLDDDRTVKYERDFTINKELPSKPVNYRGDWTEGEYYDTNDIVYYEGSSYIAVLPHEAIADPDPDVDTSPPDPSYWDILAEKGEDGAQGIGINYFITGSNGFYFTNNSGSTVLTATILENGAEVTGSEYRWYEDGNLVQQGASDSYTVSASSVDSKSVYEVEIDYNGETYSYSQAVVDIVDGADVVIPSINTPDGIIFKNDSDNLNFTAELFEEGGEIDPQNITYQWYLDGSLLGATTQTVSIDSTQINETGLLRVVQTYDGTDYDAIETIYDVLDGKNSKMAIITSSDGFRFKNSEGEITLTAEFYDGGSQIGSNNLTYNWYESADPSTSIATSESITITPNDVTQKKVYNVDITYDGTTYNTQQDILDVTDGMGVLIEGSNGFSFHNNSGSTDLIARLYEGGQEVQGTVDYPISYQWKKFDSGSGSFVNITGATNKSFTVNASDVNEQAVYKIEISYKGETYTFTQIITDVEDGYNASLINDNGVVIYREGDDISTADYSNASTEFAVFRGTNDVTSDFTLSVFDGSAEFKDGSGNLDTSTYNFDPVTGILEITELAKNESGWIILQADKAGLTLNKRFNVSTRSDGDTARTLVISAESQIFKRYQDGSISPSSGIDLTAELQNYNDTVEWTYSDGTAYKTGKNITVDYADLNGDSTTFVASTSAYGLSDRITINVLDEGEDSLTAILSNESHTVPTDSYGNNQQLSNAQCSITIYKGFTDITSEYHGTGANGSINVGADTTLASGDYSWVDPTTIQIDNMNNDSELFQFEVTHDTYSTIYRNFTLSKAKRGTPSKVVDLVPSKFVATHDGDGNLDPSSQTILLTAYEVNHNSNKTIKYEFFKDGVSLNGGTPTTSNTFKIPTDGGELPSPNNSFEYSVKTYEDTTEIATDSTTIYGIKAGQASKQYIIHPLDGTDIKNHGGTLELQLRFLDGNDLQDRNSGDVKLATYDGTSFTVLTSPYNPTFDDKDINGILDIYAIDTNSSNEVLDSITLMDVTDGKTAGSIESTDGLSFIKKKDDTFEPSSTTLKSKFVDVQGNIYEGSIDIFVYYENGDYKLMWSNSSVTDNLDGTNPEISVNVYDSSSTVQSADQKFISRTASIEFIFTDPYDGQELPVIETVGIGAEGKDSITVGLTNESHSVMADPDGNVTDNYAGAGTGIFVFDGLDRLVYDATTPSAGDYTISVLSTETEGMDTSGMTIVQDGNDAYIQDGSITFNSSSVEKGKVTFQIDVTADNGDIVSFKKVQSFTKSLEGEQGIKGDRGVAYIYRGVYTSNTVYTYEPQVSSDVVIHNSTYYYLDNEDTAYSTSGDSTQLPPDDTNSNWVEFGGQFESIATDILLAEDATIRRKLTMGENNDGLGSELGSDNVGIIQSWKGIDGSGGTTTDQTLLDGDNDAERFYKLDNDGITAYKGSIGDWDIANRNLESMDNGSGVKLDAGNQEMGFYENNEKRLGINIKNTFGDSPLSSSTPFSNSAMNASIPYNTGAFTTSNPNESHDISITIQNTNATNNYKQIPDYVVVDAEVYTRPDSTSSWTLRKTGLGWSAPNSTNTFHFTFNPNGDADIKVEVKYNDSSIATSGGQVDAINVESYSTYTELNNAGLIIFNSPDSYFKMGSGEAEMAGLFDLKGTIKVDNIIVRNGTFEEVDQQVSGDLYISDGNQIIIGNNEFTDVDGNINAPYVPLGTGLTNNNGLIDVQSQYIKDVVSGTNTFQTVGEGANVTFNNLDVTGTINYVNETNLQVEDKTITVNKNGTDTSSEGAGLIVERGASADESMLWNSTDGFDFTDGATFSGNVIQDSGYLWVKNGISYLSGGAIVGSSTVPTYDFEVDGNTQFKTGWVDIADSYLAVADRLGVGTQPYGSGRIGNSQVQIDGSMDITGSIGFIDDPTNQSSSWRMFQGGSIPLLIMKNYASNYGVADIRGSGVDVSDTTVNSEATLALYRGNNAESDSEFLDLYNNGYHTSTNPKSVTFGINIQKRGVGKWRPFIFGFDDGTTYTNYYTINPPSGDNNIEFDVPTKFTSLTTHQGGIDVTGGGATITGEKLDIRTYGASTSKADNRAEIQSAIDDSASGKGYVFIPTGTFQIQDNLDITGDYVTIVGTGWKSIIKGTGFNGRVIEARDRDGLIIKDLKVKGDGINASNSLGGIGLNKINKANTEGHIFENVWAEGMSMDAFRIHDVITAKFIKCLADGVNGHGFDVQSGTSITFDSCYALTCTKAGYYLEQQAYTVLNACATDNAGIGYEFRNNTSVTAYACGCEAANNRSIDWNGYSYRIGKGQTNGEKVTLVGCYSTTADGGDIQELNGGKFNKIDFYRGDPDTYDVNTMQKTNFYQQGSQSTPTVAFGDADTGLYSRTDGILSVTTAGSKLIDFEPNRIDSFGDFYQHDSFYLEGTSDFGVGDKDWETDGLRSGANFEFYRSSGDVTLMVHTDDTTGAESILHLRSHTKDYEIINDGTYLSIEGENTELFSMDDTGKATFSGLTTHQSGIDFLTDISDDNYTSGILGSGTIWDSDASGGTFFEVDNVRVRGSLRTHIFKKDIVKASNAYLYISDAGELVVNSENKTTPSTTGTDFTITVKEAVFSDQDKIQFKDEDLSSGGTSIYNVEGTVQGGATANGDHWDYTVTLTSGTDVSLESGDTFVRTSGGAILNDASSQYSPFLDVLFDSDTKVRLGNVRGASPEMPNSDTWGLYAKDNIFLDFGDSNIFKIGKNVGATGEHGIRIDSGNYWYGNNNFLLGGTNGIYYGGSGNVEIRSDTTVKGNLDAVTFTGGNATLNTWLKAGNAEFGSGIINIFDSNNRTADGLYISNGTYIYGDDRFSFAGGILKGTSTSVTGAGWTFNQNGITSPSGNLALFSESDIIRVSSSNYYVVMGDISQPFNGSIGTGYGFAIRDKSNNTNPFVVDNNGAQIAGWNFTANKFSGTNATLWSTGTFQHDSGAWELHQTGSGFIANGNIQWGDAGNVTFANSVSLNWENYADGAVNDLQVGARNLFENSDTIAVGSLDENGNHNGNNEYDKTPVEYALEKAGLGTTITISFDVEAVYGDYLRVYSSNTENQLKFTSHTFNNFGSEKQRLSFTTEVIQGDGTNNETNLEFFSQYDTGDYYRITNIKVEVGDKATDWTLAPEDLRTRTTVVSGDYIQTGRIKSTNWQENTPAQYGTIFDLDDGSLSMGYNGSNVFHFDSDSNTAEISGITMESDKLKWTGGELSINGVELSGKFRQVYGTEDQQVIDYAGGKLRSGYDMQLYAYNLEVWNSLGSQLEDDIFYYIMRDNTRDRNFLVYSRITPTDTHNDSYEKLELRGDVVQVADNFVIPVGTDKYATT